MTDSGSRRRVEISTSPRATWLWASDELTARDLRARLEETGSQWQPARRGGAVQSLVTDVDIGVEAFTACEVLAAAGYTFQFHASEHELDGDDWPAALPGMLQRPPRRHG